jgi:hypothetical protein
MTEAADERLQQENRFGSPAVGAIAVWLVIQLVVLGLCAACVPLWYHAPEPLERLAVEHMLVAQLTASALLFPWLMRNVTTALCVVLTSAPFVLFAGMLAETELRLALRAWAYLALWLAGLTAWAAALRSPRSQLAGVALLGVLAGGTPVVRYLAAEFAPAQAASAALRWIDPLAGALSQLRLVPGDNAFWISPVTLLITGVTLAARARSRPRATGFPQD